MPKNWITFSNEIFLGIIQNVNDFDDFNTMLKGNNIDNTLKGDLMEYFAKLYFESLLVNNKLYRKCYLYSEIPDDVMKRTKLPAKDKGIDGILIDHAGKIYALQVKFRSDQKVIPFGELATFPALSFGTDVRDISGGVMLTNCDDVCDELKGDKYINVTYDCFDKCDGDFWDNARKVIQKQQPKKYVVMKPFPYQEIIFQKIKDHYTANVNGRLYLPCGTGKTFIGFWATVKILNCNTIFVVVPSLYLLNETYGTWIKESQYISPQYDFTLIGSDIDNRNDCEYKPTTDVEVIKTNLKKYAKHVVITTYQSSGLLLDACKAVGFTFDFGIFDEAHRTTGESNKCFTCLLSDNYNIATKRLFMTATEKVYRYSKSELSDTQIFSMDDEKVYGTVIHKYSTRQAITEGQLVDYKVVAPFITSDLYKPMIENNDMIKILSEKTDKNGEKKYEMILILLCVIIRQAMNECKFTHLLIFSNKNSKARKIYEILTHLIDDGEMYLQCLSGSDSMTTRRCEVKEFEKAKRGIISSARIFGEGVNIKRCDAVCFADNKGSTVDIVQYVGRCLRKFHLVPNKIGYVLIPFLLDKNDDDNFFSSKNESFLKLRRILKILGDTDDVISEKFSLMNCGEQKIVGKDEDKKSTNVFVEVSNATIDTHKLAKLIISNIFDKKGDRETRIRNMIINENKKRLSQKEDLIDTKQKCIQYWKYEGIDDKIPIIKNWVKYCLGGELFDLVQKQYYIDKNQFVDACRRLRIDTLASYRTNSTKDPGLPSIEYINNGFYYDTDSKFNLQLLLSTDNDDNDI